MADVAFNPKFIPPTPWVDARDRVQADGPNGFNVRFAAIADDLATMHDVVGGINASLNELGQQPTAKQQRVTLSPALVPIAGTAAWGHDIAGFAVRPVNQVNVAGLMPVSLPVGAQLQTLRVVGQNSGTAVNLRVRVDLMRSRIVGAPEPARRLARVSIDADPFDGANNVPPDGAAVDATFRYFLLASVDNAAAGDVITLSAFQIIYLAP